MMHGPWPRGCDALSEVVRRLDVVSNFDKKLNRSALIEKIDEVSFLDELDPEYHRTLTRWRHVATALNVRCMYSGA